MLRSLQPWAPSTSGSWVSKLCRSLGTIIQGLDVVTQMLQYMVNKACVVVQSDHSWDINICHFLKNVRDVQMVAVFVFRNWGSYITSSKTTTRTITRGRKASSALANVLVWWKHFPGQLYNYRV